MVYILFAPVARPLTYIKEIMNRIFNKSIFIFRSVVPCYHHDINTLICNGIESKYILGNKTGF
jgi:hypothetical protein